VCFVFKGNHARMVTIKTLPVAFVIVAAGHCRFFCLSQCDVTLCPVHCMSAKMPPPSSRIIFRLRNDLSCVAGGVKLYSLTHSRIILVFCSYK